MRATLLEYTTRLIEAASSAALAPFLLLLRHHGTVSQERTREDLAMITPFEVLQMLKEGNIRFAENRMQKRDHLADREATARGQYPIAAVLGCMDSRTASTLLFDQGIGDLFAIGIAGNVASADVLGSLEYACQVIGSKVVVVLGHTECGAVNGAIDHVNLGNLTGLLEKIKPAIDAVPTCTNAPRTTANKTFVNAVAEENVRHVVAQIREQSAILRDLEKRGAILIVGAMYDICTGRVTFL